jgi:hypothetical protein
MIEVEDRILLQAPCGSSIDDAQKSASGRENDSSPLQYCIVPNSSLQPK